MGFGKINHSITFEDILEKTSEAQILSYYFNVTNIPCFIHSPLRKDKKPSLGLFTLDGQKIYYTDKSRGDTGDTFDLVRRYFGLSLDETLNKIANDLPEFKTKTKPLKILNSSEGLQSNPDSASDLKCKIRAWQSHDLEYWKKYGITKDWLEFGDIYPISHIIISRSKGNLIINADKYAYAYVERKDGKVSLKIYQPFSKRHKWANKHDSSVWDLWENLPPKGKILIITSSRKDALCIWENTGIPSTSLQAESCLPKPQVIGELKDRFELIFVLYDNDYDNKDNPGKEFGNNLAEAYDLIPIFIPTIYKSKDSSDLAYNHGSKMVNQVIVELIKPFTKNIFK